MVIASSNTCATYKVKLLIFHLFYLMNTYIFINLPARRKSDRKDAGAQASQTLEECVRGLTLLTTAAGTNGAGSAKGDTGGLLWKPRQGFPSVR
jgi:hypothetical protein